MASKEEELYDRYLDACLSGAAEDPALFFARHPELGEEVRLRIEGIHRMLRESTGGGNGKTGSLPDELPAERLGEFRLLRRLDAGGMGMVFLAEQESLDRRVALKIIRPDLQASKTAAERFRREALAVARLRHPNIVDVHAMGEEEGLGFIAMELVPGHTLSELYARAAAGREDLPVPKLVEWMRDVARALAYAHGKGIVHRDVKPANIRVTPEGRPLLLDFGIARDTASAGVTLTQTFAGSPHYAAPEQIAGSEIDGRADVYGLGVTLYEGLTGRVPFAGGSMEQIIKRALAEDAMPPRRLNPAVSRDLDVICMKALEKEPGARYETADALADDLDAVLSHRPIRARPPTPLARFRKWCRRRPGRAATFLSVAAALVIAAVVFVLQEQAAARKTRSDARKEIAAAREGLEEYGRLRDTNATLDAELAHLDTSLEDRHLSAEAMARLDAKEDEVRASKRRREELFYEIIDHLDRARQLDPELGRGERDDILAAINFEKMMEARTEKDLMTEEVHRALVRRFDTKGRFAEETSLAMEVHILSDPPGADVYLFRYRNLQRDLGIPELRWIPVPYGDGARPASPDAWALRVVRGAGGIATGAHIISMAGHPIRGTVLVTVGAGTVQRLDRLVSVDGKPVRDLYDVEALGERPGGHAFAFQRGGISYTAQSTDPAALGLKLATPAAIARQGGVPARVHDMGETRDVTLPPGLQVRATGTPLYPSSSCLVGKTPWHGQNLPHGEYLALLRLTGHDDVRISVGGRWLSASWAHVKLPTRGSVPPGFIHVAPPSGGRLEAPGPRPCLPMMDREVTCEEYLAFLNDPATLAEITASDEPVRYPRGPENRTTGGYWPRDANGLFQLHEDWRPDWPVVGVSWHDAEAYARWKTARDREAGRTWTCALPTFDEWRTAAVGDTPRRFVYGDRFRPRWIKSCYARPTANIEPVLRFPIDESYCGAFDMTGSAMEWLDDWYDQGRDLRRLGGGSWAQAKRERFGVWDGVGFHPEFANGECGLRLVLRSRGE